jgi:hypothetical protein
MEQTKKSYPNYHPGQFLTSDNLTDSFSYLEEQERITRANMTGYGILNGLTCSKSTSNEIVIETGTAVTSDGFYISFPKFNSQYAKKYEQGDIDNLSGINSSFLNGSYFLLSPKESEQLEYLSSRKKLTSIQNLQTFAVGIIVDIQKDSSIKCNQLTCDINNTHTNIVYRPMLIPLSNLEQMTVNFPEQQICDVLGCANNGAEVIINYRDLRELYKPEADFSRFVHYWKPDLLSGLLDVEGCNLFFDQEDINKINLAVEKLNKMQSNTSDSELFLQDLGVAITEFYAFFNYYLKTYIIYSGKIQENRLVILSKGSYRNVFTPFVTNPGQIRDKKILVRLFKRIPAMINAFRLNNFTEDSIEIIPSRRYPTVLGMQSIPAYYNVYDDFIKLWKTIVPNYLPEIIPDIYLENYSTLLNRPFFRISGLFGKDINTTYTELERIINEHSLPISIQKMELMKIRHITKDDHNNLEAIFKKSKNFSTTKTRESSINKLFREIADINKYYDKKNKRYSFSQNDVKIIKEKLDKIMPFDKERKDSTSYLKLLLKNDITKQNTSKIKPSNSIHSFQLSLYKLHSNLKKSYLPVSIKGTYSGGVYENSTLLLFYFNQKIVMGINIPQIMKNIPEKYEK